MYLESCPFCKSKNLTYDGVEYNGLIDSRLYVECKNCKAGCIFTGNLFQKRLLDIIEKGWKEIKYDCYDCYADLFWNNHNISYWRLCSLYIYY